MRFNASKYVTFHRNVTFCLPWDSCAGLPRSVNMAFSSRSARSNGRDRSQCVPLSLNSLSRSVSIVSTVSAAQSHRARSCLSSSTNAARVPAWSGSARAQSQRLGVSVSASHGSQSQRLSREVSRPARLRHVYQPPPRWAACRRSSALSISRVGRLTSCRACAIIESSMLDGLTARRLPACLPPLLPLVPACARLSPALARACRLVPALACGDVWSTSPASHRILSRLGASSMLESIPPALRRARRSRIAPPAHLGRSSIARI